MMKEICQIDKEIVLATNEGDMRTSIRASIYRRYIQEDAAASSTSFTEEILIAATNEADWKRDRTKVN